MNENLKKASIVGLGVVAVVVVAWQGYKFFTSSTPQYVGKPMGNFSQGRTGKQAMVNSENSGSPNTEKGGRDLSN